MDHLAALVAERLVELAGEGGGEVEDSWMELSSLIVEPTN